jgi:hypothetical protein
MLLAVFATVAGALRMNAPSGQSMARPGMVRQSSLNAERFAQRQTSIRGEEEPNCCQVCCACCCGSLLAIICCPCMLCCGPCLAAAGVEEGKDGELTAQQQMQLQMMIQQAQRDARAQQGAGKL